jgi:predicted ATPase
MIRSIKLINFLSFKECSIHLRSNLNVLRGTVAGGKHNFLKSFRLLRAAAGLTDQNLDQWVEQEGGFERLQFSGYPNFDLLYPPQTNPIVLEWTFDSQKINDCLQQLFPNVAVLGHVQYTLELKPSVGKRFYIKETLKVLESLQGPECSLLLSDGRGQCLISDPKDSYQLRSFALESGNGSRADLVLCQVPLAEHYAIHNAVATAISQINVFESWNLGPTAPCRKSTVDLDKSRLSTDAANLSAVLHQFKFGKLYAFEAINRQLSHFAGYPHELVFEWEAGVPKLFLKEEQHNRLIPLQDMSKATLQWVIQQSALFSLPAGSLCLMEENDQYLPTLALPILAESWKRSRLQYLALSYRSDWDAHLKDTEQINLAKEVHQGTIRLGQERFVPSMQVD